MVLENMRDTDFHFDIHILVYYIHIDFEINMKCSELLYKFTKEKYF